MEAEVARPPRSAPEGKWVPGGGEGGSGGGGGGGIPCSYKIYGMKKNKLEVRKKIRCNIDVFYIHIYVLENIAILTNLFLRFLKPSPGYIQAHGLPGVPITGRIFFVSDLVGLYSVGFILEWVYIRVGLYPGGFISGWVYIRVGLYPGGFISGWAYIRVGL